MEGIFSKGKAIGKVMSLPISAISPNPNQPRRYFNEKKITELAESIRHNGLIQPIVVRSVGSGKYELIAGERRLRACKSLGCKDIPAVLKTADEKKSAVTALAENLMRDDLSFFEEAEALKSLCQKFGLTQGELATKIGKTQSTVANKLRLLRLPQIAKDKIIEYNLSERHARALLRIEDEKKLLSAIEHINDYELNVSQSERYIEKVLDEEYNVPKKESVFKTSLFVVKDFRLFINSMQKAVTTMNDCGISAKENINEEEDVITYTVTIKKDDINRKRAEKERKRRKAV